jgi:hypothetical protein
MDSDDLDQAERDYWNNREYPDWPHPRQVQYDDRPSGRELVVILLLSIALAAGVILLARCH